MKKVLSICLATLIFSAMGVEDTSLSPRQMLRLKESDARAGETLRVRGIVTFVSGLESNRFLVASQEQPQTKGVIVRAAADGPSPAVGDLVQAKGALFWSDGHAALASARVDVIRHETLGPAKSVKQADFRRGILEGRRISLSGTVREVRTEETPGGPVTSLNLFIDNYTAVVKLPGRYETERLLGEPLRMEGLARSVHNANGEFLDAELEVSGMDDVEFLRQESVPRVLLFVSVFFGAVLLFFAGMFLTLWLRTRRQRCEMEVIASERRRMAADLHDTIEQHLAGANLLAAGVLGLENVPEEVREAMKTLASLLANAKAEVRNAVLNLRSAGDTERTLEQTIGDMAAALVATGVKARRCLRGLPEMIPEGAYQDIVLILREATTNAVKHGKAKQIVFTADPRGERGFVLRVLNDGAPFEVAQALGPETGHYGLSGMRERALRNRLGISWGVKDAWTYMELVSEGGLS